MGIWSIITGGVTDLVGKYFDNKKEKQEQIHSQKVAQIQGKHDWETMSVRAMVSSLKDEWFTLVFSLPLVSIFVSPFVDLFMIDSPYVKGQFMDAGLSGLAGLSSAPDWYTYLLGMMVGASFGVKGVGGIINKLKKGK